MYKARLTHNYLALNGIFLFLTFFFFPNGANLLCQSFSSHKIALTPKIKPESSFDEESYRVLMQNKYANTFKTKDELNNFINYSVLIKKQFFESNYIYSNLPEISKYVKDVLNKVIPQRLWDTALKVYIVRDSDFNASVIADGSVFVNIGLLAGISNEAELAAVLCHEFGHYDAGHNIKRYKEIAKYRVNAMATSSSGYYGMISYLFNMKKLSNKFIDNELESDNYSIKLMREKGINPEALRNNFRMFQLQAQKHTAEIGVKIPWIYFKTHPSNAIRLSNVENQFTAKELNEGLRFFNDSAAFFRLKNLAVDECINLLFEQKNYEDCIELCYKQHLFFPRDEFYLFFLLESLNRISNIDPSFAERFFITGRYNNESLISVEPENKKIYIETSNENVDNINYQKSVFYHLTDFIFGMSRTELTKIRNLKLKNTDTLEFLTNKDALRYFKKTIPFGCGICNMYFSDSTKINTKIKHIPDGEIEKRFTKIFLLKDTIAKHLPEYSNYYSIVYNVDSRSRIGPYSEFNASIEDKLYMGYLEYSKKLKSKIKDFRNINFRDKSSLDNSCTLFINLLPVNKSLNTLMEAKLDFFKIDPEILDLVSTYEISKLIFTNITLSTDIKIEMESDDEGYIKSCFISYCLDFSKHTAKYIRRCVYLKHGDSFDDLYREITNSYVEITQ